MSLLWTLRKLIDPVEWMRESEEKRSAREDKPGEPKDGGGGISVEDVARPAEVWACRICSHESGAGSYCAKCLADTMQRKK